METCNLHKFAIEDVFQYFQETSERCVNFFCIFVDSYSKENVDFRWTDNSPVKVPKLSLPQFKMPETVVTTTCQTQYEGLELSHTKVL